MYSELSSILKAVPRSATWRRAKLWWQGPTCHCRCVLLLLNSASLFLCVWHAVCSCGRMDFFWILLVFQEIVFKKCLRVIRNHPRRTLTYHLHNTLKFEPIPIIIHLPTAKFFAHCPSHLKPSTQLKNRELNSSHLTAMYKKHKHNRPKHILP